MAWRSFFVVVLAMAVGSARGTCVFNSEFGFTLNCGFRKSSLFRVRNLGGVKGYVGLGFSVGDELGFAEALSNTDEADNQRRSTSDGQDLQNLRSIAMSTGRSSGARSPQLSWNMAPAGLGGTAGVLPGTPGVLPGTTGGVVPPFKPLASKDTVVPPFSALPPSIARIPVIKPAAPPVFQPPLQQMSNRRFQQVSPSVTEMPLKNSIVVGSVETLPSPMQQVAPPSLQQVAPPALQRPSVRQTAVNAANVAASLASKTKVLQSALHHGTYDGFDLTSPSPLLMGHSLQSLSKASNISVEALAAALRLREQQLLAALTSTTTTTTTTTSTTTTTPRPTKPATVKPKYPMIGPNRVMNAPKEYYPVSYDQNYDDNFTSKVELPDTTFSCGDQKHFPGLYADEDLGCMVFHVCAFTDDGMVMKSFLCPESTLFDQSILKCNWWFYVDCKASKRLYDSNIPISKSYQLMKALAFFSAYKNQTSNNT